MIEFVVEFFGEVGSFLGNVPYWSWGVIFLILGIMAVAVISELVAYRDVRRLRPILAKLLKAERGEFLLSDFKKLSDHLDDSGFSNFSHQVEEFREGLHIEDSDSRVTLYNTHQADEFFDTDAFREHNYEHGPFEALMPPSMVYAVPGLLTSLGILGTFIGLVLGLHMAQAGGTAAAPIDIIPLMKGLGASFSTSVIGLIASMVVIVFSRYVDATTEHLMDEFLVALNRVVTRRTAQQVLEDLLKVQLASQETLQGLSGELALAMEEALGKAVQTHLVPTFTRMERHSEEMKEATLKLADGAGKSQVEGVAKLVESFAEQMDDVVGGSLRAAGDQLAAFAKLQETNTELWKQGMDRFDTTVQRLTNTTSGQEELATSFGESLVVGERVADGFRESVGAFERVVPVLEQITSSTQSVMENASSVMAQVGEDQRNLAQTTKEQAVGLFEDLDGVVNKMVSEWDGAINDLHETVEKLVSSMGSTSQRFEGATGALVSSTESAQSMVHEAGELLSGQVVLQEGIVAARKKQSEVLDRMLELATTIDSGAKQSKERQSEFRELMTTLAGASEKHLSTAQMTLKSTENVNQGLENRLNDWNRVSEEFRGLHTQIQDGLTTFAGKFPEQIRENMKRFDEELALAMSRLSKNYTELNEVAGELRESAEQIAESRSI